MSDPDAKKALETAVSSVGKAYGNLLRVAEKHGDDISKDDYAKAQYFLTETIRKIWEKIDVVREVAKATAGEFSLDSVEIPDPTTIIWRAHSTPDLRIVEPLTTDIKQRMSQPIIPLDQMDGRSLAKAIGGRLTKEAQRNVARPDQSINIDLDDDDLGSDSSDELLNDVDFIDDK